MKFRTTMIALGTVASLALAAPAMASGSEDTPGRAPAFSAMDTDGDGQLTREELRAGLLAHREAAGQARLDRMAEEIMTFANPDGMLGADELRRALEAMTDARREAMQAARADGSSAADRGGRWHERRSENRPAGRAERQAEGRPEGWSERRAERRAERQAERQPGDGQAESPMRERMFDRMFDRMDSDSDGVVSAAEYEAAVERMAARMAERSAGGHPRRGKDAR